MLVLKAKDDFVEVVKEIPKEFLTVLAKSFLSVEKVNEKESENTFINDLLSM